MMMLNIFLKKLQN